MHRQGAAVELVEGRGALPKLHAVRVGHVDERDGRERERAVREQPADAAVARRVALAARVVGARPRARPRFRRERLHQRHRCGGVGETLHEPEREREGEAVGKRERPVHWAAALLPAPRSHQPRRVCVVQPVAKLAGRLAVPAGVEGHHPVHHLSRCRGEGRQVLEDARRVDPRVVVREEDIVRLLWQAGQAPEPADDLLDAAPGCVFDGHHPHVLV